MVFIPPIISQAFGGVTDPVSLTLAMVRDMRPLWLQVTDRVAKRSGFSSWQVNLPPGTPGASAAGSATIPIRGDAGMSDGELALVVVGCFARYPDITADEATRVAFGAGMGLEGDLFDLDTAPTDLLASETPYQIEPVTIAAIITGVSGLLIVLVPILLPILLQLGQRVVSYATGGGGGGSGGGDGDGDGDGDGEKPSNLLPLAALGAAAYFLLG